MNFKHRNYVVLFAFVVLFSLLLSACGGGATLTYRVDGTAEDARIKYIDASGSTQDEVVDLPWETSIDIPGEFDFEIVVMNEEPIGEVGCTILIDEKEIGEGSSAVHVKCSGNFSRNGSSRSYNVTTFPVEAYLRYANEEEEAGNFDEALAEIDKALAVAPSYAEAYYRQGIIYAQMEDNDPALAAYTKAIEFNPEHKDAFNNRGYIHHELDNTEQAIDDWSRAIEIDPEYVLPYFNRAQSYFALGDYDAAKADVLKVQELSDDPDKLEWAEGALAEIEAKVAEEASAEEEEAEASSESEGGEVTLTGEELPINTRIVFASNTTGNFEIYSMNLDGTDLVQLTDDPGNDGDPELSPDGSKIVFYSNRNGNKDIYVMDRDGGNLLQLTDDPGDDHMPTWSPNGEVIAYVSDRNGNADIFLVSVDGSESGQFTDWPSNEWHPTWNPSAPELAFVSDQDGDAEIFLLASDGSSLQLTNNDYYDSDPDWSPNGRFIVYSADPAGGKETNLFLIQPDGSGLQQVTDVPGFDLEPTWSADSSYLLFTSNMSDGNVDIYMLEEDGTFFRITSADSVEGVPSW